MVPSPRRRGALSVKNTRDELISGSTSNISSHFSSGALALSTIGVDTAPEMCR